MIFVATRSPGCVEVYHQGDGTPAADWFASVVRHCDICHHRAGVLLGGVAQDLLQLGGLAQDRAGGRE